jgi:hypothetical protein
MVCTGTIVFIGVKGQKLTIPHGFKMESNEARKLCKLIMDMWAG